MNNLSLTLRKKIYVLSILSSFFLIGTIWLAYDNLNNVSKQFEIYSVTSKFAKENIGLARHIEALQSNVQKFTYTGLSSASDNVEKLYLSITKLLTTNKPPEDLASKGSFSYIQIHLKKYYQTFKELKKQVESGERLKVDKRIILKDIEENINRYFHINDTILNKNLQHNLHNSLHDAEKSILHYFDTLDNKYIKASKNALRNVDLQMKLLINNEKKPSALSNLKTLQGDINSYSKINTKEIQHTKAYQFLVTVVMAAEAYEVYYHAGIIGDESQKILEEIDYNFNKKISYFTNILISSGISFLFLMIIFSILIIRSIVNPIGLLTNSFTELTAGKTNAVIPAYSINDEIGHLTIAAQVFLNKNIEMSKLLQMSRELSESLNRAKIEAEQANKAKSDFLANMSHEIRTPLSGVIGLTDLVLKSELNDEQRGYLEKSKTSSKALLHIINDILDYSKIEAGKLELENNLFELDSVMNNIRDLFEYQVNKKGLVLNIDSENMILIGDSLRLTQIITNIVGNAVKFTKKGYINITSKLIKEDKHYKKIKFSIKDSGVGIDLKLQKKLFKEFSQADNSITRQFGGTGLGLSISKQIVSLMSGEIWVESTKGAGSEFIFTATFGNIKNEDMKKYIESNTDKEIKKENNTVTIKSIKGSRILVVEDNTINQIIAVRVLEELGLRVELASNGKEAVENIMIGNRYDLIIMDLQMPIMDGFEASKLIKDIDQDVPIVALSAAVMPEDKERSAKAKMSAHLAKPIDQDELIETLLQFIEPHTNLHDEIDNIPPHEQKSDEPIAQFYGVDVEALKNRIGNKPKVVIQLISNFCQKYENADQLFNLSKVETEEFSHAIHSLKGVSGNISLKEVYILSKEIHETPDIQIKKELTPKLIELLTRSVKRLKAQLDYVTTKYHAKEYAKDEVIKQLKDVAKDVKHFRAITQDRVVLLEEMLTMHVESDLLKELSKYLLKYKYKDAEVLLDTIKTTLEENM